MDMAMVTTRYREFISDLKALVNEGKVPMSRIDDAVTRILRVKFATGLMDRNRSQLADRSLQKSFGSPEHREVALQAVRESIVLLKNDVLKNGVLKNGHKVLPLSKKVARIHVGGKTADDLGNQSGGWTISWQGQSGDVTPGGTTILTAIQHAVSKDTRVTFSKDGTGAAGADLGVVVIGEKPHAEFEGDRSDLSLAKEDVDAFHNMKSVGIPVVVILMYGRPMIVNDVLDQADAFLAAWLPGTEGQGVADVLFGDYRPTGKHSFSWRKSMAQMPVNIHNAKYDPLFRVGFGLKY